MRQSRVARLLHTVRHLRAGQLLWQLRYRLLPRAGAPDAPKELKLRNLALRPCVAPRESGAGGEFRFLNASSRFDDEPDWAAAEMPKLWRYNLHYFDYALAPDRSQQEVHALIDSWIRANPAGTADAWEPYPASLRIVNWIKYFRLRHGALDVPAHRRSSLWQQAAWLARNLERHILANHYLKNVKALVFAGAYFDEAAAKRWLKDGTRVFAEQVAEQFLADGGHYERSPMYHAICTEDLLDVLNLAQQAPSLFPEEFCTGLRVRCISALRWLEAMCMPDGAITLFNDSAFGIAPTLRELHEYAARLGVDAAAPDAAGAQAGARAISLEASGYYILGSGGDKLVIDCGAIGPDYQPGHTHCDTLSYELALNGRRVIVDTGVHDYEASPHRRYARGTAAHNTVMVDGEEQSEMWGAFRVARRARPLHAGAVSGPGPGARFEGAHDGYRRLAGGVLHKRMIEHDGYRAWRVQDTLEGRGQHTAESFLHLHPTYRAVLRDATVVVTDAAGGTVVTIEPDGTDDVRVDCGWYFPEFGQALRNDVIILVSNGELPRRFGYRITKTVD